MKKKTSQLTLRKGVGIVLLNNKNKIFVGKRADNPVDKWQMPQGGVNKGENLITAMKRELMEETSIQNIKVLKKIDKWFEYELPKKLIGIIWKGKYKGQKQKWFVVKFLGNEKEININTKKPEFLDWKWINLEDLTKIAVNFKLNVYKSLKKEIFKILKKVGGGHIGLWTHGFFDLYF